MNDTKIIVTLGPSTKTEADLRRIKDKGVDFVRVNMSHSSVDDLKYFIGLSKKIGIPFIIDTEGSQIRTGELNGNIINLEENEEVRIFKESIVGDKSKISLKPNYIVDQLEEGDLVHLDFNSLILRISDVSTIQDGYITAKTIASGTLGRNKAVVVDSGSGKKFILSPLSDKDYKSIELGLQENIGYIAASFMRSGEFIDEVRRATRNSMKIISKIECIDALENLDEIIDKSDFLLVDRGDLSKEVPIEKIPLVQKIILNKARKRHKGVFVATNLLETMIGSKNPTRAEINDVINTVLDGASGLTLSSETAIGKYPMECINMLNKLIRQAELAISFRDGGNKKDELAEKLEASNYLLDADLSSSLIAPHGGKLVNRILREAPSEAHLDSLQKLEIDQNIQMDAEQIAIGTFSPIEGFMKKEDLQSVLDKMRLQNGEVWTIPIVLDISEEQAEKISIDNDVALTDDEGTAMAILHVEEKYKFDKEEMAKKLYGTVSEEHPGVRWVKKMKPIFLGGKIDLIRRRKSEYKAYDLTPKQVRRLFEERRWAKVVGFHTRNVIHRSHEFIQLDALEKENCDGLFVHPVIGKKKVGDFNTRYIIESYEHMMKHFYPKDRVIFSTFSTFSRYAGPREAVFTALCRKNFGCSHFIVGRDHTGVGNFYHPKASHEIFDKFPDLGIKPIKFDNVFYSTKLNKYVHEKECPDHGQENKLEISGTQARKMLEKRETPPEWFMRPEISKIIIDSLSRGEEVFVKEKDEKCGCVIWFTGLSGSGKTTIALEAKEILESLGKNVEIIDGDAIRNSRHKHLSFSREDIKENNRLIAELAKTVANEFDFVLVPIISPYKEDREMARSIIKDNFLELFINASLEKCIKRDIKGLYKKALAGEIDNFIGVSEKNPYEFPQKPDIEIKTDNMGIDECVCRLVNLLKLKNLL